MESKQKFRVLLTITQECDEDMTEAQMKKWVQDHFKGSDYGKVKVVDCDLHQEK